MMKLFGYATNELHKLLCEKPEARAFTLEQFQDVLSELSPEETEQKLSEKDDVRCLFSTVHRPRNDVAASYTGRPHAAA